MKGISSQAAGGLENKYKFQKQELQHQEFSDGSGLEMYEFKYRFDDPQTGRFWSIDPLASDYVYNSPYAFSEDKVTSHIELEGLECVPYDFLIQQGIQWLTQRYTDAQSASARLANGTSGETESQHVAAPLKGVFKQVGVANDINKAVTPYVDILHTVSTLASLTPIGEAGAATEITVNTFRAVGQGAEEVALNTEGKAIVNAITKDPGIAQSFKGSEYEMVQLQSDIKAYRTFGGQSGEKGSFFGFNKPTTSASAEKMYNLNSYGNDASFVTPVTIKKGTQIAIGKVEGGTGAQIYIPTQAQGNKVIYSSKNTVALPQ